MQKVLRQAHLANDAMGKAGRKFPRRPQCIDVQIPLVNCQGLGSGPEPCHLINLIFIIIMNTFTS